MKQIILGSFGIILLMGTLIACMNIFSITVHKSWLSHSIRAERHRLGALAEEASEDEEFCEAVEAEFMKCMRGHKIKMEIMDFDREKGRITIRIEEEIPYIALKKKIIRKEYHMRWKKSASRASTQQILFQVT